MSNKALSKWNMLSHPQKVGFVAASAMTIALVVGIPVAAWFTNQRKLADLQYVNSPSKLYVTAAHGEEIKYLDLSDVQVTKTSATSKYYVFAVTGSNANAYNLQLAYTTNNQFEYFIYPAKEWTTEQDEDPCVSYVTHTDTGTGSTYYYTIDKDVISIASAEPVTADYRILDETVITRRGSSLKVEAGFLNKETNQIKANNTKHDGTYNYNRGYVQDCAEPLYWQAKKIKSNMEPTTRNLVDYYILEVNWEKAKDAFGDDFKDNGETDIIYISVEASTVT